MGAVYDCTHALKRIFYMNNIKSQFKILFKRNSFIMTLLCSYIFSIVTFVFYCFKEYGKDIILVPAAKYLAIGNDVTSDIFGSIFYNIITAMAIIPFADTYFEERQNGMSQYCIMRTGNKSYYFSKMFTVFFSGFFVVFSTVLLNHLLNFIAFPCDSTIVYNSQAYQDIFIYDKDLQYNLLFSNLFVNSPYLYNLLFALFASLAAGFMAVFVFQISFFYKKNRVVLICSAFIGYVFLDILMSSFGNMSMEFCLGNYIFPARFYCDQSVRGLIVTFSALIIASLLPTPFAIRKMRNSYD